MFAAGYAGILLLSSLYHEESVLMEVVWEEREEEKPTSCISLSVSQSAGALH